MADKKRQRKIDFRRNVVPDRLDLRDRPYMPDVSRAPKPRVDSFEDAKLRLAALDQRKTSACTGFALARVIDYLLNRAERRSEHPVSPFMLYSMARRYDEFPGHTADEGSSLRGALKGWYKHGACFMDLWKTLDMPAANASDASKDWWQESAKRPLGAYYRIDTRAVTDMHLAIRDVGVIYASAFCHAGWDEGADLPASRRKGWTIPYRKAEPEDGGHAFAIVGYDAHGFLVLNSWGERWGDEGLATLTYQDWLDNAMDCWVAQLGVVTDQHQAVSRALTLRREPKTEKVELAADRSLRNQELSPFIVDMENNGKLSESGDFRTNKGDVEALWTIHFAEARKRWGSPEVVDVAVYAHGGLTGEAAAADTASRWIPALYDAQIFPIFLMWETDLLSTLVNKVKDVVADILAPPAVPTAGVRDQIQRFLNRRIERSLSKPGSVIWGEMKQNADAISNDVESGGQVLYRTGRQTGALRVSNGKANVRLHLVGHSAGSIVHSHVVDVLAELGWKFATVTFLAPAVTCRLFENTVLKWLRKGRVAAYHQFHLKEEVEEHDPTCRPILGYGRSLLYLVSESFEGGSTTPILGLERDFRYKDVPSVKAFTAPGGSSASATHGGFDDDKDTMNAVIRLIKGGAAASRGRTRRRAGRKARA